MDQTATQGRAARRPAPTESADEAMKGEVLIQEIDAVLLAIPTEQQINILMRYGDGPRELKEKIVGIREKLETLKAKVSE
jgi:hypothetical protein